jgi:hypothetical protein
LVLAWPQSFLVLAAEGAGAPQAQDARAAPAAALPISTKFS